MIVKDIYIGSNGKINSQTDISYTSSNGEWVPSKWTANTLFTDGKLDYSADYTVKHCTLNSTLNKDAFEIKFIPGTWVTDSTGEKEVSYILKSDDDKRAILPADDGATYDQLANSSEGRALENPEESDVAWIGIMVGATAVLSLVGLLAIRYIRQSAR